MKKKSNKINLKDCLQDDTLDLSMSGLKEVPVKEIAAFPKATTLDLSNNQLITLGTNFPSSLSHLVKLDLSSNRLTSLPENFGLLVHLKHLDLFKNQLTTLPLSFGNLKALKWLDLKDNPLVPKVAQIVGQCLNPNECHYAAKNAVTFLAKLQKQVEEEKKRRIELEQMQEGQDSESQSEKKETKQKKKKKKKAKNNDANKEITENGMHTLDGTDKDELSNSDKENSQKLIKRTRSRVVMVLSGILKFIVISVLLSLLSIFIISLINEPTYQIIRVKLNQYATLASSKMPKNMVSTWNKYSKYVGKYTKQFMENVSIMFRSGIIKVHEWYLWFSTDEKVQIYVETVSHYWHVAYIKFTELFSSSVNFVSSYVKN